MLQTAVTSLTTSIPLNLSWAVPSAWPAMAPPGYYLNLYYTDFQNQSRREFDIYYNGFLWETNNRPVSPTYLFADYTAATALFTDASGFYNVSIIATNTSVLPPILSAYKIYYLIQHDDTATDTQDGTSRFRSPSVPANGEEFSEKPITGCQNCHFQVWKFFCKLEQYVKLKRLPGSVFSVTSLQQNILQFAIHS